MITGLTVSASHENEEDTAVVLWDTAVDSSFLITPHRDSEVDIDFLCNPQTTKALEDKLALRHAEQRKRLMDVFRFRRFSLRDLHDISNSKASDGTHANIWLLLNW